MPPSDGELIRSIIANDLQAFDELFNRYRDSVYRFACYLTHSQTEADDLFQETWLRVVKYLPTARRIRDFRAWILTIAVNIHRDELRRKRIRNIISPFRSDTSTQSESYAEKSEIDASKPAIDESDRVAFRLALERAVAALPLRQRQVFILKEIEGLKHAEIGEILNAPVGTIKSLLHKAIKNLQQQLSDFK